MTVPVSDAGDISGGAVGVLHTDPWVHPPLLGTARHQRKCSAVLLFVTLKKKKKHFIDSLWEIWVDLPAHASGRNNNDKFFL